MTKTCTKCGNHGPFGKNSYRPDGLQSQCIQCRKLLFNSWLSKNKHQTYATKAIWISKNRERHLAAKKAERQRSRLTITGRASKMVSEAKRRAQNVGLDFDLTTQFVIDLLSDKVCSVTGIPFDFQGIRAPFIPSIDRIDNAKGYVCNNIQLVVFAYNLAKDKWTHADVMLMARSLIHGNESIVSTLDCKESRTRASRLISDARKKHRKKNNDFDITVDDISCAIQNGKCAATGLQFNLNAPFSPMTPSLDQIIPSIGYTRSNTQVVSLIYNLAKGNWTHADVITLAKCLLER